MSNSEYSHLLGKVQDAQRGGAPAWRLQSTGERVAVALALNRADWLQEMDYTMVEAIERTGANWLAMLPAVVRELDV